MTENRVGASHTDQNGFLKLTSALDFVQDCELFWLEGAPALMDFFLENGAVMVLAFRKADIARRPVYGERLTTRTAVYQYTGCYGYRTTDIVDEHNKTCIATWGLGVTVNVDTGRVTKIPAGVMAQIRMDEPPGFPPPNRRITPPPGPPEHLPGIPVRDLDIDVNRHVNNVRYIEAAMPLLPGGFTPTALRVEYRNPARRGDTLYPVRRVSVSPGGAAHIALNDTAGRPYAAMEFMP